MLRRFDTALFGLLYVTVAFLHIPSRDQPVCFRRGHMLFREVKITNLLVIHGFVSFLIICDD